MAPKVLFVLTSQEKIPATGAPTGWYLPEFAHPYDVLKDKAELVIASPKGGAAPLDPGSAKLFAEDPVSSAFVKEKEALWTNTVKLSDVKAADFDAILYVGGHGPMFDLYDNADSLSLIQEFAESKKPVAAVCHGPVALLKATAGGKPVIEGAAVTGLANAEEDAVGMTKYMPLELETELGKVSKGGYVKASENFGEKVVVSRVAGTGSVLITGQNPSSATAVGKEILKALNLEYPRAIATEPEETLWLSVKQYIPIDNPNPKPGDITIIGAHANGFPKELYEPLWEEIYARAKSHGFGIRGIWIADVAHQGNSGVLNENVLGNDPSWFDHPRDLLHFINLKRAEMPRPIFGVGHSMGGNNLINLALMHARLITSLVLMDPVVHRLEISHRDHSFHTKSNNIPTTTAASSHRRDIWPSRSTAAELLKKNKFYQTWDPRVLDRWIQYGLRELPTALHPLPPNTSPTDEKPVTLTTSSHQEVFTFSRPNYTGNLAGDAPINRLTHPDLVPDQTYGFPFYRPEAPRTFAQLPHLRPSVFYIFADKSDMCLPQLTQDKLNFTGTGVGGSGGVAEGRVKSVLLNNVGHLIPMEAVGEAADHVAGWIGKEMERWRAEEEEFREMWAKKSTIEKTTIDEEWKKYVKPPVRKGERGVGSGRSNGKL
ncbi:hypothetical protein FQN52_005567 [Onygenales sp. PD_12]|nr:hypothetical protein FQN52_005567 [Onygenales sp. PD_12]